MLEKEFLQTCAPIGILESSKNSWKAIASGVFIYDNPFIWYVTSRQQICDNSNISLHVLLGHKKVSHILFPISSMHEKENINWIFDEQNDIAATLFPADPDLELKAISFEYFLASQDMLHAMHCYSVGYPYIIAEQDTQKIAPYILEGIISRIDESSKVYVTTPTFPDNYGCPIFVWKSPFSSSNSIDIGGRSIYLGGIITKTITVEANTGKDGSSSFQPIYLSVMSASESIKNLLSSPKALSQKKRMKEKNGI